MVTYKKMTVLNNVSSFLYFLLVATICNNKRDVNIIMELARTTKLVEALSSIKTFFSNLVSIAAENCWRIRIWVAGFQLVNFKTFDCYSLRCISEAHVKLSAEIKSNIQTKNW